MARAETLDGLAGFARAGSFAASHRSRVLFFGVPSVQRVRMSWQASGAARVSVRRLVGGQTWAVLQNKRCKVFVRLADRGLYRLASNESNYRLMRSGKAQATLKIAPEALPLLIGNLSVPSWDVAGEPRPIGWPVWKAAAMRIFVLDADWPLEERDVEPTESPCDDQVDCAQWRYREGI